MCATCVPPGMAADWGEAGPGERDERLAAARGEVADSLAVRPHEPAPAERGEHRAQAYRVAPQPGGECGGGYRAVRPELPQDAPLRPGERVRHAATAAARCACRCGQPAGRSSNDGLRSCTDSTPRNASASSICWWKSESMRRTPGSPAASSGYT